MKPGTPSDRRRRVRSGRLTIGRLRGLAARHLIALTDTALFLAVMVSSILWAIYGDLLDGRFLSVEGSRIECDEALLLVVLSACGLAAVAVRYHLRVRHETERRMLAERQVRELAYQDGLTGLPNRRRFEEALKAACAAPAAPEAAQALLLIDLNRFKAVNDIHGHAAGDEVLMVVAQRLLSILRESDVVARLGGDEFAILTAQPFGAEGATTIAMRVIEALEEPIHAANTHVRIGAAIGIAMIPADATHIKEALRKADIALYRAKADRRSSLRFFGPELDARVRERAALETALREATENGGIDVTYRPTVDLRSRAVVAFDAAPRWLDRERGEVPPDRFIAVAEETGLVHAIGDRVLREACLAARGWPEDVAFAIHAHASQLADPLFPARVARIMQETGLHPGRLEIGITESALLSDPDNARHALAALRAAGVRVALENFGTGYSSLHHLLAFRLDKVKIDSGFVVAMRRDARSASVVRALIGLGRGLGLAISADGIAEIHQQSALLGTGCELGQGALFSPRLSAADAAALFGHAGPEARRRRAAGT